MKIMCLDPNLKAPTRATEHAAGYDVFMLYGGCLQPGETQKIPLGFATAIPEGYAAFLLPRSGAGSKGLLLANTVGLIDADYRGEWLAALTLRSEAKEPLSWAAGDKLVQFVLLPVHTPELEFVSELPVTERGAGGFGSTGK